MDGRSKAMIVAFLLCVIADTPAEGHPLDVCTTCHSNATCDDKPDGSGKVCNCKYGFVGNGRTFCQDKDECQIGASKICGQHTTCYNTYGSYYCTCLNGYNPSNNMAVFIPNDGTHCRDIDECRITGLCGEGGQCRNLEGSFDCSCQVGYQVHNGAEPFHPNTDNASCKVVDCGKLAVAEDTVLLSATGTTYSSMAMFDCEEGFVWRSGDKSSVCGADGLWTEPTLVCEAKCGPIPFLAKSEVVWHNRSVVIHRCVDGYHSWRGSNVSVCGSSGLWQRATLTCIEISCGPPLRLPRTNFLWDGTSRPGSVVLYECTDGFSQESGNNMSTCLLSGQWGKVSVKCKAKCGPIPFLAKSEVVWHNRTVVIHRCVDGYHSWRGSNVSVCGSSGLWQRATLTCTEIKPPISHIFVLSEKCLHWTAEKYEDTEVYKVTYVGSRDYQRSFQDRRTHFLMSKAKQLRLCFHLLPVTNYSISITALSSRFTATITTNTSLPVPPAPVVYYGEFETPVPTLKLHRSPNTLDPLSLYQVFVLPGDGIMMFDCSEPSNQIKSSPDYISAQIHVAHVGREMNFTVGDGLYYGGFFNAPLESGRNYYIILRAVSQWKSALKTSCVLWAKVRGTSYVLRVSSLSAAATIGLIVLVILGRYCFTWFYKRT